MKRAEQIEVATAAYINGRLRNNVPPEEIEEIRLAYQAGAIYADRTPIHYEGKAMLYVLNKGHEQGYKDAIDKACEWLKCNFNMPDDFESHFRKAMEENK